MQYIYQSTVPINTEKAVYANVVKGNVQACVYYKRHVLNSSSYYVNTFFAQEKFIGNKLS